MLIKFKGTCTIDIELEYETRMELDDYREEYERNIGNDYEEDEFQFWLKERLEDYSYDLPDTPTLYLGGTVGLDNGEVTDYGCINWSCEGEA